MGSFTCTEYLIYACRQCVPGLQGCGKKKGSNTLRETCMSYVKPVIAQVSISIHFFKKLAVFSSPAGLSVTKLSLAGNY